MTVPVPRWAGHRLTFPLWKARYRYRRWRHGRKRNPNCNERRRYRDDTQFVVGEHTHVPPLVVRGGRWDGLEFERVSVPVKFFRIDSSKRLDPEDLLYLQIHTFNLAESPEEPEKP